jgi:hypothetical protein
MKQRLSQTRKMAETLAIQALAFMAEEPERFNGFLAATGLSIAHIRTAARQPGFLAGVLEHMLADEILLVAFADGAGIDPADIARAHEALTRGNKRGEP